MTASVFVDTNVLLCAHDLDAGSKYETAKRLVAELWSEQRCVLSTQVLQEFYVNVTRKLRLPRAEAREVLVDLGAWKVERIGVPHILIGRSGVSPPSQSSPPYRNAGRISLAMSYSKNPIMSLSST